MHGWLKKILAIATIAGALTLAPIHDADAAVDSFLVLKGAKSGVVGGGGDVKVKKAAQKGIRVLAFTHQITSPRDASSGLPTGKRQHKPFRVTIEFDTQIIAILIGLMTSGEQLEGTITFKGGKKGGKQEYMTFELKDVLVSSYSISSTTGGDDVIELELKAKSFQGKLADGSVFVSSAASPPAVKEASKMK